MYAREKVVQFEWVLMNAKVVSVVSIGNLGLRQEPTDKRLRSNLTPNFHNIAS